MDHFPLEQVDPSPIQLVPEHFQGWHIHDSKAAVHGIHFQHPITGGNPERGIHVPALPSPLPGFEEVVALESILSPKQTIPTCAMPVVPGHQDSQGCKAPFPEEI